jgi:hypothetical protein
MRLIIQQLRRHVLIGPAKRSRNLIFLQSLLGYPEIRQPHVPRRINEYIFGFEVSISDAFLVQVVQTEDDLHDVEFDAGLVELRVALEVVEEAAPAQIVHDDVVLLVGLERKVTLDYERVVQTVYQEVSLHYITKY